MDKPIEIKLGNIFFKIVTTFFPVKKRVFFISSHKDKLLENMQIIYDSLDCEKKVFTYNLPHSIPELIRLSYYIMTSKVILIDDYSYYFAFIPLKKQQKLLQIWHGGAPMKKIGLDVEDHHPYEEFSHDQYDDFLVSSDYHSEIILSAFNIGEEVLTKIGYPRIDLLIHNQKEYEKEFFDKYPDFIDKKIIMFVPTFRLDDDYSFMDFDFQIDWEDLDNYLEDTNSVFLIKRHPSLLDRDIKIIKKEYNNIMDIGDISNFSLMVAADLLITDYSGIFNEYLLLNKPIIFYCPDLEKYAGSRGFYCKIPDDLPGTVCQNYKELIDAIINQDENVDYSYHKEKILQYCDGNSTKNLLKIIEGYLE